MKEVCSTTGGIRRTRRCGVLGGGGGEAGRLDDYLHGALDGAVRRMQNERGKLETRMPASTQKTSF